MAWRRNRAVLGQDARVGISRRPLDAVLLENFSSEAELVHALVAKDNCYLEEEQLAAEVPSSLSKGGRTYEKVKMLKRSQIVVLDDESEGEVVEEECGNAARESVATSANNEFYSDYRNIVTANWNIPSANHRTTVVTFLLQILQTLLRYMFCFCK